MEKIKNFFKTTKINVYKKGGFKAVTTALKNLEGVKILKIRHYDAEFATKETSVTFVDESGKLQTYEYKWG